MHEFVGLLSFGLLFQPWKHTVDTESVPKVEVHLLAFGAVTWREHILTKFSRKEGMYSRERDTVAICSLA